MYKDLQQYYWKVVTLDVINLEILAKRNIPVQCSSGRESWPIYMYYSCICLFIFYALMFAFYSLLLDFRGWLWLMMVALWFFIPFLVFTLVYGYVNAYMWLHVFSISNSSHVYSWAASRDKIHTFFGNILPLDIFRSILSERGTYDFHL